MRSKWTAPTFLALIFATVSCTVLRSVFGPPAAPVRPFNHSAHADRGLDCATCHEAKDGRMAMPDAATCMGCHEELDADKKKPREQKVEWYLDAKGAPQWSASTRQDKEVVFSHQNHEKVACASCHAAEPGGVQRMSSCMECHRTAVKDPDKCETCHTVIGRDVAPSNHKKLWTKQHGLCARDGKAEATANNCAMCHGASSCTSCHQSQAPADHTTAWKFKPHGIAAGADRERCQVCHKSDSCDRCHQESAPRTHGAGWNGPQNRHCTGCHLPLAQSDGCFVCHRSTPGHDTAPGKPAWHSPQMDCRSCHAATMAHPDNGDNCNSCHK